MTGITEHLAVLQARIAAAARAAGRDPAAITLLAASKGQPPEAVAAAAAAGITHFGENYAQEGAAKVAAVAGQQRQAMAWHFIGRLQANKTAVVADAFDWVQTVTDARLASRLGSQRRFHGPPLQVCIQVAPEGPAAGSRMGCPGSEVSALAAHIASLPRLALRGLMLLPLPDLTVDELRAEFRRLARLLAALRTAGHDVDTLSCGMSGDFELAIAEGSTMVRIGTALFGPRPEARV